MSVYRRASAREACDLYLRDDAGGGLWRADRGCTYVIGSDAAADIRIRDAGLAPRHAGITGEIGGIHVMTLAETTMTVNGEAIRESTVHEGDRIGLGLVVLVVVAGPEVEREAAARQKLMRKRLDPFHRYLAFDKNTPLAECLRQSARSPLPIKLSLRSDDIRAEILIARERLVSASIHGLEHMPHKKAFHRMLGIRTGDYEVETCPPDVVPRRLASPRLVLALEEGIREVAELTRLGRAGTVPRLYAKLTVLKPADREKLTTSAVVLLELAAKHGYVEKVIDESPETDLVVVKTMLKLMAQGYLRDS